MEAAPTAAAARDPGSPPRPAAAVSVPLRYFTVWALGLHAVVVLVGRRPAAWCVPTACVVALVGAYLTHVHPRELAVPSRPPLRGGRLLVVDAVFHQLVLVVLCLRAWREDAARRDPEPGLAIALVALCLYVTVHDPREVYGLRPCDERRLMGLGATLVLLGAAWRLSAGVGGGAA